MHLSFSFSSRNNQSESQEMYEDCEVLASMVAGEGGVLLPSQGSDFSDIHINFDPSSLIISVCKLINLLFLSLSLHIYINLRNG